MKLQKIVPSLRFIGFIEPWNELLLEDLGEFKNGLNKGKEDFGFGYPFINLMDVFGKSAIRNGDFGLVNATKKDLALYNLKKGDVLFIRSSVKRTGVGETSVILEDLENTVYSGFLIRFREKSITLDLFYKRYCFSTIKFRNELLAVSTTSANTNVNQDSLCGLKLIFPSLPEQQKIASFLTAVDDKIQQLSKKKALLDQYKKGVMQQLFSQKLRFKDDQGNEFPDWEEKKLEDLVDRITTKNKLGNKNVLTISAQHGLISQLEFFNHSVAAKDLSGYYLLSKDDFAYNKSYSAGYPMGAIKRLKRYDAGVVSTLYICFRINTDLDNAFAEQYFETGLQNKEIEKVAQEGARNHGLLNIGVADFFSISLTIPSKQEQTKIANFLSAIDNKINLVNQQLKQTRQYKKGLLQQMFV